MPTTVCEACGRPLLPPPRIGDWRYGVLFTAIKCELIDLVVAAGVDGITTPELMHALYRERKQPTSRTVKVHIFMINTILPAGGWRIVNERRRWFMRKVGGA
jgi:hypothetical protein